MSQPTDSKSASSKDQQGQASSTQAEMAQAFKDLARGEQQAAAIEANLTNLENKLDALLAAFEANGSEATEAQQLEQDDSGEQDRNK
ncbi:hypothetical protein GGR57DRAFT_499730 [Xylariaceae sp. FL1272]|nr:hypothetical protein GGR57DRAFT_499730 [Xylariaceae sp. FL1272]